MTRPHAALPLTRLAWRPILLTRIFHPVPRITRSRNTGWGYAMRAIARCAMLVTRYVYEWRLATPPIGESISLKPSRQQPPRAKLRHFGARQQRLAQRGTSGVTNRARISPRLRSNAAQGVAASAVIAANKPADRVHPVRSPSTARQDSRGYAAHRRAAGTASRRGDAGIPSQRTGRMRSRRDLPAFDLRT